jgi:NADH-quinone oxidoreductase subunit C
VTDAPVVAESPVPETPAHELLPGCPLTESRGQAVVHCPLDKYLELVTALKDDGFDMCVDVTAADYLEARDARVLPEAIAPERFELVVNLLSLQQRRRLRVRVQVPATEPTVPTLFPLYAGTEAMEREVFDMFGIVFDGHPDLTRILMPEDWEGHPLRKDYDQSRIPVQFKGAQAPR